MATCKDIIARTLRRLGVIASGEVVGGSDMIDSMEALRERVDMLRLASFGKLKVVDVDASLTAETMTRVIKDNALTVTLPTNVDAETPLRDGDTIEVRDKTTTTVANYRWSAETARWVSLDALTENTEFPLGAKHEAGFIAHLAVRLASDYGIEPSISVLRDSAAWMRVLTGRFEGDRPAVGSYY